MSWREVHARLDAGLEHPLENGVANAAAQEDRVDHERVCPLLGHNRRPDTGNRLQEWSQDHGVAGLASEDRVELLELDQAHRRLHLGQAPVVTKLGMLVEGCLTMVAQKAQS